MFPESSFLVDLSNRDFQYLYASTSSNHSGRSSGISVVIHMKHAQLLYINR